MKLIIKISILLISVLSQVSEVKANSCQSYLTGTSASNSPLLAFALNSKIPDGPDVHSIPENLQSTFQYDSNEKGQLINKHSGQIIDTSAKQFSIGVWDINDSQPGHIYGTVEKFIDGKELKHSSFNNGDNVLSAWALNAENGLITRIVDGSGHYRPSPISIYLALKKFESMGLNINETVVLFMHGLGSIKNLQISAFDFIKAMEGLSPTEVLLIHHLNSKSSNLDFFLNILSQATKDSFTKGLILAYQIRNKSYINIDLINKFIDFLKTDNLTDNQFHTILRGLYHRNHAFLRGSPRIRNKSELIQNTYYEKLRNLLLVGLDNSLKDENLLSTDASSVDNAKVYDDVKNWFSNYLSLK